MPVRHKVVPAVIFLLEKDGRYLLHLRQNTGYMDNMWSLPGGHVEQGEHLLHTVIREAREELGITVTEDAISLLGIHHMLRNDGNEGLNLYYKITAWTGEPANMEPERSGGLEWFSPGNLPDNVNPEFHEVIGPKPAHFSLFGITQPRLGTNKA